MPKAKSTVERKIYLQPDELERIEKHAEKSGLRTTKYMKHIALHGEIKKYSLDKYQPMVYSLRGIGVRINQIAAIVNQTKSICRKDVEELYECLEDLTRMSKAYFSGKPTYKLMSADDERKR